MYSVVSNQFNRLFLLTYSIETGIENADRCTVTEMLGNWVHQNWKVSTNIVHNKQENADCR